MFYGTYALRDAMNAAASGDVINLSGGAFQAVDITKAVTLYGTGFDDVLPTYINNDFTINIPSDDTNQMLMEGVGCSGNIALQGSFNSPFFFKCKFSGSINYNDDANIKNAMFADCKIQNSFTLRGTSTVQFVNSYICCFMNMQENLGATFANCVIYPNNGGANPGSITNSMLLNSIIYVTNFGWGDVRLPASTTAMNCISIGYGNLFGNNQSNTGNRSATYAELFQDFNGTYSESQQFELTDEAKTNFFGTDGTEVGMHGGLLPYNSTPSYPQITKMKVANRATADGKLSVEIEVSAAQ